MPAPISNAQFPSQSMPSATNPNVGKTVTGQLGAKIDFTQATMSNRPSRPSPGFVSPNQYPRESWQSYTSRPTSRWAQTHGGVMNRSGSTPNFQPFGNTPTPGKLM